MLFSIAGFEFRYQLRNPVFWVAVVLFFLLSFGSTASDNIRIDAVPNLNINAPFAIGTSTLALSIFFMFVSTAFVANVVVRDDETGFAPMLGATRLKTFDYLYGRYLGALAAAALAFAAVPLGLAIGSAMPWLDPEKLGPFHLDHYLYAYGVMGLPVLVLTSAGFFALATATRSMMATYVGLVAVLVAYFIANGLSRSPDYETARALLEPFGFAAFSHATRYWTAFERNTQMPPLAGLALWNRLIWLGVAVVLVALAYPAYGASATRRGARRGREKRSVEAPPPPIDRSSAPPAGARRGAALAQFLALTRFDLIQVFKSPAFFVLLGLGLLLAGTQLWFSDQLFGSAIHPVTRVMIRMLRQSFLIIPLIVAIFYAGELVWRERDRRTEEIVDAAPAPDWAFVAPKIVAVALALLSLMAVSVVTAMGVQALKGYFAFELDKYLFWYVLPAALESWLLAVLAVFVQVLSPHKFVGWLVMVVFVVFQVTAANLGLDHNLYQYGGAPDVTLSDMNGMGLAGVAAWWFRAYWTAVAVVLALTAYLLWRRGVQTSLWPRLVRAPDRLRGLTGAFLATAVIAAVGLGGFIFLNTNVWNAYRNGEEGDRWAADYEKTLLRYETLPQPKITDVKLQVDLYPHQPRVSARGVYTFENRTNAPIRELHVRFNRDLKVHSLSIEGARPTKTYDRFNYRIFSFDAPLQPGERRKLAFETERSQRGFKNADNDQRVVGNGAFINNFEIAPILGMDREMLLTDRAKRRKYGLAPALPLPVLEDEPARQFNLLRKDSDWVSADVTVSTEADQVPIAPGYKVFDQVRGGRRTAEFRTEAPILHFFSIQSARYAEIHRSYKGVDLALYFHPAHAWNVDRMLRALEVSLDYDQANFSPYQFRQARILEFPAFATFAQSYANTIPYSEDLGWIFDFKDPEKIDMVTYVTAHELGHQWWGHQVIGANVQGVTLLDETLAQYSALMVMEKLYGRDHIKKFLKYSLDRYLRARGSDPLGETALLRVEGQGYIHYDKGALVMYRLKEELGEDKVNAALREFLAAYAFKGAPFPTSRHLVDLFRAEARADQQDLITDLFEKITLYDLKATAAQVKRRPDGRYDVRLTVSGRKLYADAKGKETPAPLRDTVDIGLFAESPSKASFTAADVLVMQRVRLRDGVQQFDFVTSRAPKFAGVDPYNKLIDRNSDDNVVAVSR